MDQEDSLKTINRTSITPWIITILIGAWLIGMSILGAGWLISKEIARQGGNYAEEPYVNKPIDIAIPEDMPKQGSDDAPVTIVEFADFQCPFCGQWHSEIYPRLKSEYIDTGKVKFVFWDFAFLGDESTKAAEAAACAMDQGKFWEYHDALFENQAGENENAFAGANLKEFASNLDLDQAVFNQCVDARTHQAKIESAMNQAVDYEVNSTPTVFINGLRFEGVMPWESYQQIIETELAK